MRKYFIVGIIIAIAGGSGALWGAGNELSPPDLSSAWKKLSGKAETCSYSLQEIKDHGERMLRSELRSRAFSRLRQCLRQSSGQLLLSLESGTESDYRGVFLTDKEVIAVSCRKQREIQEKTVKLPSAQLAELSALIAPLKIYFGNGSIMVLDARPYFFTIWHKETAVNVFAVLGLDWTACIYMNSKLTKPAKDEDYLFFQEQSTTPFYRDTIIAAKLQLRLRQLLKQLST